MSLFDQDHAVDHHRLEFDQQQLGFGGRQHDADLEGQVGREVDDAVGGRFAALVAAGDAARKVTAGGDLPPLDQVHYRFVKGNTLPAGLLAGVDRDGAVVDGQSAPSRTYGLRVALPYDNHGAVGVCEDPLGNRAHEPVLREVAWNVYTVR